MKKLFTIAFLVLVYTKTALAQVFFTNDGAIVTLTPGSFIYVQGSVVNQDSGTFDNSGTIIFTGDWINNAGNFAFINSSPGSVILSGDTQNIQGTSVTKFYDLILQGTGVKVQKTDAIVEDSLALNDRELATDTFTMFVTSTDTGAVTRTTGFVSSLGNGSLSRNTAISSKYLFPVGSGIGTPRYRPVEITPDSVVPLTFTVRMANVDATTEGFDRNIKDSSLCLINPDFYHRINRTSGINSADITVYFDNILDGSYQNIAHWQNVPQWENIGTVTVINNVSPVLSSITKSSWNDFSFTPFALSATVPIISLVNSDSTICAGDSVTFTATSGFSNYEFFVNGASVQIGIDSIFISDTLSTGDTIKVVVTLTGCSVSSNEITSIIVNVFPVVDLGSDTTMCGGTITLDAGNPTAAFSWSTTETTKTIVVNTTGTYWVDVTNAGVCNTSDSINVTINPLPVVNLGADTASICSGDTIILDAGNPGAAYLWNTGVTTQTITVDSAGSYDVTVTDTNLCSASDTIVVLITGALPVVELGNDTAACGSVVLDAGINPGAVFSWSTGDSTQTITVTATDTFIVDVTNGCGTVSDTIAVTVNPFPIVDLGTNTIVCGDTDTLDAGNTGAGFSWSTGETTQTIVADTSGTYWVDVTFAGCTSRDSIDVTINSVPVVDLGTDTTQCSGSVQLDAGNTGAAFNWSTTDTTQTIVVVVTGTYWVDVTITGCPIIGDSIDVTINPIPAVDLGPDTTICDTCSIMLDAGTGFTIYNWSTGDTVQTLIVDLADTYFVQVTDADGCINADTVIVSKTVIVEESFIFVPSAFSPNGDGVNDLFRITGEGITNIYLAVYNRWGEMVFETEDIIEATEIGWDGRHKGEEQAMAVFVYYVEVGFTDGKTDVKKGDVTLIR